MDLLGENTFLKAEKKNVNEKGVLSLFWLGAQS